MPAAEAVNVSFAKRLLDWHRLHGRRNLPWQRSRDPYLVWISEVMLQQTQVAAVIPYFDRFVARFPSVMALADAPVEEVMRHWAGLGYYARARNLHQCARQIAAAGSGQFPATAKALAELPGIGPSTAAAIAAFCYDERAAILDGNVKRVLARQFGIEGYPGAARIERQLAQLAAALLPERESMPSYTQAMMDLGATVCSRTKPKCAQCPVADRCKALRDNRLAELPTPRPARPVRERQAHFLIVEHAGSVLLERRPPSGIWGGLLVPPQFDTRELAETALARMAPEATVHAWPARHHAFTHFTLSFTPLHVAVAHAKLAAGEPAQHWLDLADVEQAPLPTPIRSLLRDLARPQVRQRSPD